MAKVEQSWEPGTLDRTRKNIGVLSEEEAKRMTKVLGGEILQEKSAPIDYNSLPKSQVYAKRAVGKSANSASLSGASSGGGGSAKTDAVQEKKNKLPEISSKEKILFDKLMMDDDYKIKPSYGVFNFVLKFTKGNSHLRRGFVDYTLVKDVEHLNEFVMAVKSIVQIAPESYKEVLMNDNSTLEDKFVFLKTVGSWSLKDVRYFLNALESHADTVTILAMSDFIKAVYRLLIKIYYLGENKIPEILKEIYSDLIKFPRANKKRISVLTKTGITEWFYVYSKVIKGLYPILMRLCSRHCDYFPDFFTVRTAEIFSFLGVTKYDLMLPNRKVKRHENPVGENSKKEETSEKKQESARDSAYVASGIKLLEHLFPQAGFSDLASHPDMYPYFQPLYQFRDGYNLLSPENPLQITVTLLRISEDFLQGCRNMQFTDDAEFFFGGEESDKLSTILGQWTVYREVLFEKNYGDQIREFVNHEYSAPGDFRKSQYGLKLITQMLWQTHYYFLPYFKFQQVILDKPKNDNPYRALCIRTTQLKTLFGSIVRRISEKESTRGSVVGIANPWERFRFDIPTPVSKRLNIMLGAKRPDNETKATNANLLKYALCVISVLDWWLNDKASPAYSCDSSVIYRVSAKDGAPEFSVPLLENQNELFTAALKSTSSAKKPAEEKKSEPES